MNSNINIRAYIIVVLFALVLAILMGLGISQNWGIFHKPETEKAFNSDVFNAKAMAEGAIGLAAVDLYLTVIPPSSAEEKREVTFQLDFIDYYLRDDHSELDVVEVCLDYVDMKLNYTDDINSDYFLFVDYDDGTQQCVEPVEDDFVETDEISGVAIDNYYYIEQELDQPIAYSVGSADLISQNFWYPFDSFTVDALTSVFYSIEFSDGSLVESSINPYMEWEIQTSGTRLWDVRLTNNNIMIDEGSPLAEFNALGAYQNVEFSFARPLLYRLVLPFFIVGMVLLIAMVPLLGDRDTLVDICAAMLFGIFGLKGILGPGEQMGQTLLDIALIGLYVVLAFAGVLFFINKVMLHRKAVSSES